MQTFPFTQRFHSVSFYRLRMIVNGNVVSRFEASVPFPMFQRGDCVNEFNLGDQAGLGELTIDRITHGFEFIGERTEVTAHITTLNLCKIAKDI